MDSLREVVCVHHPTAVVCSHPRSARLVRLLDAVRLQGEAAQACGAAWQLSSMHAAPPRAGGSRLPMIIAQKRDKGQWEQRVPCIRAACSQAHGLAL
jgi:hypothetical protein